MRRNEITESGSSRGAYEMARHRFHPLSYRPDTAARLARHDGKDDARLGVEDVRARDPVEVAFRAPGLGPTDLLALLDELTRRRHEIDDDLRRLIQRAEAMGTLDIV